VTSWRIRERDIRNEAERQRVQKWLDREEVVGAQSEGRGNGRHFEETEEQAECRP
jgi:hypothetical protein